MKRYQYVLFLLLVGLGATGMKAQEAKYPPPSEYMMARDAEIALSAAPQANLGSRNHQGFYHLGLPDRARGG